MEGIGVSGGIQGYVPVEGISEQQATWSRRRVVHSIKFAELISPQERRGGPRANQETARALRSSRRVLGPQP